jgi:hypothetical protein
MTWYMPWLSNQTFTGGRTLHSEWLFFGPFRPVVRTSAFHVEDRGSIPLRDRYWFPAGGIIAEWSLAIWLEKVVRELSEKAENTFFLWITLTFHVSHVLCTEKDWFKRSVCRIQNSCFNKLHLIKKTCLRMHVGNEDMSAEFFFSEADSSYLTPLFVTTDAPPISR